jgi:predicted DNA-binding protein with PD1-like motif
MSVVRDTLSAARLTMGIPIRDGPIRSWRRPDSGFQSYSSADFGRACRAFLVRLRRSTVQVRELPNHRYLLVLCRDEEIISTVTAFLGERGIRGGNVIGIGSLRNPTLGFFDVDRQEYVKRTFEESMELGNFTGTIGTVSGKPFLHAHATVCGPELIAFTGHLFKGEVAVTAELTVTDFETDLPRTEDDDLGLKLFHLALQDDSEE